MNTERRAKISILVVVMIAVVLGAMGSVDGVTARGIPVFRLCIGLAFLINWLAFIPAWVMRTERFFDLTGAATYVTTISLALWLCQPVDVRGMLLWVLVVIWATRLGTYLFLRIRRAGKDERFDELKQSFWGYFNVWTVQGLWVSLTLAAALGAITSTHQGTAAIDPYMIAGVAVWAFGFAMEATADLQKSRFLKNPDNKGQFISGGLWSWSRHPNYFGEITLWVGIAIIALPTLQGWTYATLISPLFVFLLITRVSGVPLLEKKADKMWGGQPDYEKYTAGTSVLVPLPPKR
ncbi:MAG TPA: DUF1295 domain-containing protein [Coriobacteriia bacterium]|nr:DUF1295 domain-containing protein [Coriobacteriia bacterium]